MGKGKAWFTMSLFDTITPKNFVAYAMKFYDDPQCETIEDFYEDLNRFKYLKRLLHRYVTSGDLRERLMLNHLITLFNVFGYDACMKLLEFKVTEKEHWVVLKTLLLYLNYIEEGWETQISVDLNLATKLREL